MLNEDPSKPNDKDFGHPKRGNDCGMEEEEQKEPKKSSEAPDPKCTILLRKIKLYRNVEP